MIRIEADWLRAAPAQAICRMLTDAGHQAWFVGGCVRNSLLGAPVLDLDLTTEARPERVSKLAQAAGFKSLPTGIDHGTVTVIVDHHPFEVTTFRRDVQTFGRRAVIAFADTMTEDARRRDFTMNALYCAPDGIVVDPLGGLPDLRARRVRFIGRPEQRIHEDYLRILRFFRFHAWYGAAEGGLDPEGLAACAANAAGIDRLSKERIGQEMRKLLAAPDPVPSVLAMAAAGVLAQVLPGAGAGWLPALFHVERMAGLGPDPIRRLAALGGAGAEAALRLSRTETARLSRLGGAAASPAGPGELGYRLGVQEAVEALALRAAQAGRDWDPAQGQLAQDGASRVFPLRAADLMPGLQGPALGRALHEAEARWIASGFRLTREELLP